MTVKDLIELLQQQDQNAIVVMAKDSEGNYHSPFAGLWAGGYAAENTWSGEVGFLDLTDEAIGAGYTEEDVIDGVPAVILCPVN